MRRKETKTAGFFPLIIESMCLHLSEKESLQYLKDRGFIVSRAKFYRLKNEVKESTNERLNLIASKEFLTQHMERIFVFSNSILADRDKFNTVPSLILPLGKF